MHRGDTIWCQLKQYLYCLQNSKSNKCIGKYKETSVYHYSLPKHLSFFQRFQSLQQILQYLLAWTCPEDVRIHSKRKEKNNNINLYSNSR